MGCRRTRRRWDHPTYRYAYCVERYGNVYYVLHGGNAKALGNIIFKEANRKLALNLLDKKIEDYLRAKSALPADVGITTLYELIEDYKLKYVQTFQTISDAQIKNDIGKIYGNKPDYMINGFVFIRDQNYYEYFKKINKED